ncbi:unnamed protein product [Moneuplotes crassus]|uniref:Uncharacterized protein n=1 Tax=Euplotes crassus TaxID=5936 RepID=A0AAD1UNN2_EUPCR|nr:unnamed protein product [Moneuplotes crassus]
MAKMLFTQFMNQKKEQNSKELLEKHKFSTSFPPKRIIQKAKGKPKAKARNKERSVPTKNIREKPSQMLARRTQAPSLGKKATEKHIEQYYQNLENIMRVNNVGFFDSKLMENSYAENDKPDGSYTQNYPMVNETNYNVHVKNTKGGIVNINLMNTSESTKFKTDHPKSQGHAHKIDSGMRRENSKINFNHPPTTSLTVKPHRRRFENKLRINHSVENPNFIKNQKLTGILTYYKEINKKREKRFYRSYKPGKKSKSPNQKRTHKSPNNGYNDIAKQETPLRMKIKKRVLRDYSKILNYSDQLSQIFNKNPIRNQSTESLLPSIYNDNQRSIEF